MEADKIRCKRGQGSASEIEFVIIFLDRIKNVIKKLRCNASKERISILYDYDKAFSNYS